MNTLNVSPNSVSETQPQKRARTESVFVDVPGLRGDTKDVLQQLAANVTRLEDLTERLGFVLSEVRSVIKR